MARRQSSAPPSGTSAGRLSSRGFLGNSYDSRASLGHVPDLPKSKLGVDVDRSFRPYYTIIPERKNIIEDLKRAAKSSGKVYLASDPDREGEAIAWHLVHALGIE